MHLLYLDDSGSAANRNESYLILGGVSVHEAQAHWITQELDKLARAVYPQNPDDVEFHASEIFSGRIPPWKGMRKQERIDVIKQVLVICAKSHATTRVFACAVHKQSFSGPDPMELAFEDLCSRFDLYLKRLYASGQRDHRGLIILDKSSG